MSTQRLADARSMVTTIDGAKEILAQIARLECDIAYSAAMADRQIVAAKERHAERVVSKEDDLSELKLALTGFILANKHLFEKPRKIVTEFGSFGLRTVTDLLLSDEEAAIRACLEQGFEDCVKSVQTIVKKAAQARLESGDSIPGCALRCGDTAVYAVDRSLLAEAREKGME